MTTLLPPWAIALGIVAVIAALLIMVLLAFREDPPLDNAQDDREQD